SRRAEATSGSGSGEWPPEAVGRVVCCLASLQYVPAADVALRLQQQLLPALAAAVLSPALVAELCTAWALVRRAPPPAWWQCVESAALEGQQALAEVPPQLFVRLPWTMAQLGHVPSYEWLSSYVSYLPAMLAALPDLDASGEVAGTAVAAGHRAYDASPSSNSLGVRRAEDLANLVWALGTAIHEGSHPPALLSTTGSGALQALLPATHGSLRSMGPTQLVLLVEGLARVRHRLPPAWVGAFGEQVLRQLHACCPADLISILYCLAFLDAQLPAPWLAAVLGRTKQLLPALLVSEQHSYRLNDLAWAVAQLDPAGGLARPFLERLVRKQAALEEAKAAEDEEEEESGDRGVGEDFGEEVEENKRGRTKRRVRKSSIRTGGRSRAVAAGRLRRSTPPPPPSPSTAVNGGSSSGGDSGSGEGTAAAEAAAQRRLGRQSLAACLADVNGSDNSHSTSR
ncbi:hypothetical protein Agub_g15303, partial [Astrephomene gubernaculifera]